MSKYRVYELAKEFHTDSKAVLDILIRSGVKAANNFSSVDEGAYQAVKAAFSKKNASRKAERSQAEKEQQLLIQSADGRPEKMRRAYHYAHKVEKREEKPAPQAVEKREERPAETSTERVAPSPASVEKEEKREERVERVEQRAEGRNENRAERRGEAHAERRQERGERPGRRTEERTAGQSGQSRAKKPAQEAGRGEKRRTESSANGTARPASRDGGAGRGGRNDRSRGGARGGNAGDRNRGGRGGERADRGARRSGRGGRRGAPQPVQKVEIARPKHIKLPESIAVKDLASKMSYTAAEVIKKLFLMGVMATINQEIDYDTAALVASEFGVTAEELPPEVDPTEIPEIEDDPKSLKLRPPVVTVMGHVDHGKTSLLDCIRKTSVSAHEAGGITQHIGAYQVIASGKKIVFLDTPGHEAFTAMRARGAQITDIAILVVAADDGVMPQTIEAISHAKSAGVPIIVAINKIDKPGANPERVKQELMEHGLVPEEYGGNTIMVPVSAKKQMGIDDLLEMILLVAEMKELKANPNRDARGVIIEAKLDKGRGPVATVLVQNGTLRIGDSIVVGTTYGKVRAMLNDRGDNVKKAGPAVPVEILGLGDVPEAGDILAVLEEKQARSIAEARVERQRTKLIKAKKVSLDDLFQQIQEGDIKDLNIVVKADVQGSVEALNSSLLQLNKNDEVRVSIVHSGVGAVSESDVMLATASNALIIAFNVRPDVNARKLADAENIDIRTYRVIYDALNDVKDAMSGMLKPKYKEVVQGRVEIRQVMKFSKALVAGSYVLDGKICNNSKIRIIRDDVEIFDGEIDSLRRFKDEVKEVAAGYECGISIVDFKDFQEGDIIEPYTMEEIAVTIEGANKAAAKKREELAKAAKEHEAQE